MELKLMRTFSSILVRRKNNPSLFDYFKYNQLDKSKLKFHAKKRVKMLNIICAYLIKVLTLQTLMSYNFLTADLIWCLLAFKLQIKTKVLLSSIFFMADSVVNGCLMILWASEKWRNKLHLFSEPNNVKLKVQVKVFWEGHKILKKSLLVLRLNSNVKIRGRCLQILKYIWTLMKHFGLG